MLKFFQTFVPTLLSKLRQEHKPMGRWNLEQSAKKMKNKVDLSNEDHCGPCGQYALQKLQTVPSPAPKQTSKEAIKS